jgi:hypothetical protein
VQRRFPEPPATGTCKGDGRAPAIAPRLSSRRTLNLIDRWRLDGALLGLNSESRPVPASGISALI